MTEGPSAGQSVSNVYAVGDIVLVQNVGGDVVITCDRRAPYHLVRWPVAPAPLAGTQLSAMLHPRHGVVPFVGRADELAVLAGWAGNDDPVAVQLVHASGGQGKTRLAAQFAAGLARDDWAVWQARLRPAEHSAELDLPALPRTLVVVDYADRWRFSTLLTLIEHLDGLARHTSGRVRILLLARSTYSWWPTFAGTLLSDHGITATVTRLDPLGSRADSPGLFTAARDAFASIMGVDGVADLAPTATLRHERRVLAIHMAALAAVEARRRGDEPPGDVEAVSRYLLRREHAHWAALVQRRDIPFRTDVHLMRRVVFLATLTGTLPRGTARDAVQRVALAADPVSADALIDDHLLAFPAAGRLVLEPLHPDRLGEDLIAAMTLDPTTDAGGDEFVDDWPFVAVPALVAGGPDATLPSWTAGVLTVLIETAHRWPHVATDLLGPLLVGRPALAVAAGAAAIARLATVDGLPPSILEAIEEHVERLRRVDLDAAGAAIAEALIGRRLAAAGNAEDRLRLLLDHARRIRTASRVDEAVTIADRAIGEYRQKMEAGEPVNVVIMISAMTDHAAYRLDVDRPEAAERSASEALAIYIRWAGLDPRVHDVGRPLLGRILTVLGRCARQLGRPAEALDLAQASVGVNRAAFGGPGFDIDHYASSLESLALELSAANRHDECRVVAEEAIEIRRVRAADDVRTLPSYARCLTNMGGLETSDPPGEAADRRIREAVDVYRELAEANPARYEHDYALALLNHGITLGRLGRGAASLVPILEATVVLRRLAAHRPHRSAAHLVHALNSLAEAFVGVGRAAEALPVIAEALRVARGDRGRARDHAGPLLESLYRKGNLLIGLGRPASAVRVVAEAVGIWRQLDEPSSTGFDGAIALFTLGRLYVELDEPARALEPLAEAAGLLRHRGADPGSIAACLGYLAAAAHRGGRSTVAMAAARESIELLRPLADGGEQHRFALANVLRLYAQAAVGTVARHAEAGRAAAEATELLRPLADNAHAAMLRRLTVETLADVLAAAGHIDEAADIRRQLAENATSIQVIQPWSAEPVNADARPGPAADAESELTLAEVLAQTLGLDRTDVTAFQQAAEAADPLESARARFALGTLLGAEGRYAEAHTAFREVIDADTPLTTVALLEDGVALYNQGDRTGAMVNWIAVCAAGDARYAPIAEYRLGLLLHEAGENVPAINLLDRAAAAGHPDRAPTAALVLADLLRQRGDLAGAVIMYRRAVELHHPRAAKALVSFAMRHPDDDDGAHATAALQCALAAGDPDVVPAASDLLAGRYERRGRLREAAEAARIAARAGDAAAWIRVGELLRRHGDLDGAADAFVQAARAPDPGVATAGAARAAGLAHERGDLAAAEAGYRRVLGLDSGPAAAAAVLNLGSVLNDRGYPATACAVWRQALAAPDPFVVAAAADNLGKVLPLLGRLDEAVGMLRRAVDAGDPQIRGDPL